MEIGATGAGQTVLQTTGEAQVNQQIQRQNDTSQQAGELQAQSAELASPTPTPDPNQRVGGTVDTFA